MKGLKGWIIMMAVLLFFGLALLAYWHATRDTEPESPGVQESGMIYVEVMR